MPAPTSTHDRPRRRPATPSIAEQHAEWVGLLRPDGPFLALPVLTEALPQGLDTVPDGVRDRIRQAWEEVSEAPDLLLPAWYDLALRELLRYPDATLATGTALPEELTWPGRVAPDAVAYGPDPADGRAVRLHLYRRPWDEQLTAAAADRPIVAEQAAQLCRNTGTPLALITNGRWWVLVHARPGEAATTASFDADLWLEEPALLRAFATLLASSRVLPPATKPDGGLSDSLAGLFARSAQAQAEVTTTLGGQVLRAVELLVDELARLDREAAGRLLAGVSDRELGRAALTVLMRLVFLLYAEEQRLLPVADDLYASAYAVSTLYDQLEEERNLHGDEVGDRRSAAWPRLLALFTAVHRGCEHPDLRIPAYGGSLLDPARFPWLAGAAVTDRVVREILDALLMLHHRGKAAQRLSYKGLDVEQIGHVYEGLLEFSCVRVDEPYLGLSGKEEPELPLVQVESARADGEESFRAWLKERCDATPRQVERALVAEPGPEAFARLHAACDNDTELTERVRPYWGLLRTDLRDLPTVYPAGSVLFTQVGERRATGTHYTPRKMAEEIVEHTLTPLCFSPGPADGADPGVWRAKTADELLSLKVLDPAMGSGAFLVSACRYLADRVVDAWTRDGVPADIAEAVGPDADRDDLRLAARRLVAARCLYGVDRDDMALGLGKLSLWLVTLAKDKPFGFLDHALRHGDSLIGLVGEDQLVAFHLDPAARERTNARLSGYLDEHIDAILGESARLRESIEASADDDLRSVEEKAATLGRAERLTDRLRLAADSVAGAALSTASGSEDAFEDRLTSVADEVLAAMSDEGESPVESRLREQIDGWLRGHRPDPIRPLHWPLEFPEVMRRGGFDVIVSNPPFISGKHVSGAAGSDYREYLVERIGRGRRGHSDMCAYFLLRDLHVSRNGRVGTIATNTIAQGDTREVGLDQIASSGWSIYRAEKSQRWPGTASLQVSLIWIGQPNADERRILDGRIVPEITPSLEAKSLVSGNPHRLAANKGQSFIGSYVMGTGFILRPAEARALLEGDSRNADVLAPYLDGDDLNSRADCSARRWVIDFHDWSMARAQEYTEVFAIVEREVRPQRLLQKDTFGRRYWWRFFRSRPELRDAIAELDAVLVIARVSKTGLPVFVSSHQVMSDATAVFPTDRPTYLALLSSAEHWCWWTTKGESTLETRLRYTPSDGFETFPQPRLTARMEDAGEELDSFRRGVMLDQGIGLTDLYNLVYNPGKHDPAIVRLRDIHVEIDEAVRDAYALDEDREPEIRKYEAEKATEPLPSWREIDLDHGFYDTRQGTRFTIGSQARLDVLDKLLALNQYRYAQEVARGLHMTRKTKKTGRRGKARATGSGLTDVNAPNSALF